MLVLFLLAAGCSEGGDTYTTDMQGGVKYVYNTAAKWGDNPKVKIELTKTIGSLESSNPNLIFRNPTDVVRDKQGNIFILDSGNFRIQKFNSDGEFLLSFGRRGKNDGEFMQAQYMDIDDRSNIYVQDYMKQHMFVFTSEGDYFKKYKTGQTFFVMCTDKDDKFVSLLSPEEITGSMRKRKFENKLLRILDDKGNQINLLGKYYGLKGAGSTIFRNALNFDVDENDNIYTLYLHLNLLEKLSLEGRILFRSERPLNYKIIRNPKRSENITYISKGIGVDGDGRIWVATYQKQPTIQKMEESIILKDEQFDLEIFDKNGVLLGKIPFDGNFDRMRVFDDYIYFIDTNNKMCVYEYKIIEN